MMSDAGLGVDVAISLPPAYSSTQPAVCCLVWASTTSWRAGRVRLLSAVALMAVRPSPPSALVGKQARALDASDRRTYFGSRAAVAAVAGGHSDHFSSLHDTVPSRRQASKASKRAC